jgi:V-type H+-transporting ATPase subunit a
MGLLRSEKMMHGIVSLPLDPAKARLCVDRIGQATSIQFEDANASAMKRPYRKHIQRLEEMERILRFLGEEVNRFGLTVATHTEDIDVFLKTEAVTPTSMDEVESKLKKMYKEFLQLNEQDAKLIVERNHLAEEVEVLKLATKMLTMSSSRSVASGVSEPLLQQQQRLLNGVAGVVAEDEKIRFARALFNATRGTTFTHFQAIDEPLVDPKTGMKTKKQVFVVFFQGSHDKKVDESAMMGKIRKVCGVFGINMYNWPQDRDEAWKLTQEKTGKLEQQNVIVNTCEQQIMQELREHTDAGSGEVAKMEKWRLFCVKEKSIYATLNLFEESGAQTKTFCWFAASEEAQVRDTLKEFNGFIAPVAETEWKSKAPTYIRTNEFTDVWQCVINTYGVPRYQEANPALFATVSFPFIFGMMYGDVGHGTLLMLAGAWMCYQGKALLEIKDVGKILYWVRFLILQLGIYATFAGFLYNDMFSVGLQIFDTRYEVDGEGNYHPTWDIKNEGNGLGGPYPFGVDWSWHGATNELLFMNSLKMKLSVLFGVLQMTLGLALRFSNAVFFKSKIDFFCECIPCLIFMVCFFGWMDFMILYKWVNAMDAPPGVINSLICMAMGPMGVGQTDEFPLWKETANSMSSVQLSTLLMNFAMIAVPWLLLPKPFFLLRGQKKDAKKTEGGVVAPVEGDAEAQDSHDEHDEHDGAGEIIIHQVIETIEYVLGTVSHTASYLRIWALSLAHQQLSEVFFTKTISMGLSMSFPMNGIAIYIMFTVWFCITFAVLLGMDVLECFLHTLRLHWVEFDSKFFKADGVAFEPYNIKQSLEEASA